MKQFLLGVLATVVAGLALFLLQDLISEGRKPKEQLEYNEFAPSFYFSADQAAGWQKQVLKIDENLFSESERLAAVAIIIENTGKVPIQNQRVVIRSKYEEPPFGGVLSAKNDFVPGTDESGIVMSVKDGRLIIDYKLLDAGEFHRFWIVKDRYADLSFIIRKPGMKVTGWDAKIYRKSDPEDWTIELLFGAAIVVLIAMIAVGIITANHAKKIAAAHGMDPDKFFTEGELLLKQQKKSQRDNGRSQQ